ncbi:MAG: hypothetical protein ACFFBD_21100 [Candidatus Hodarchaeota archaeon]
MTSIGENQSGELVTMTSTELPVLTRVSTIPPEAAQIFSHLQNSFDEPRFEPVHIKIGSRFAGVGKFIESIMAKLIFISFVPSIVGVFALLVPYIQGEPFELTLEKGILIASYTIVTVFLLWIIFTYFWRNRKKAKKKY